MPRSELFRQRPEVTPLLRELRRNPATCAILDGNREGKPQNDGVDQPGPSAARSPARRRFEPPPVEDGSEVLRLMVDYSNGMTQAEIAQKYGFHVQTVRKRLKDAGVVVRGAINHVVTIKRISATIA